MNSLRILLVEGDQGRADQLVSLISSCGHSSVSVPDLSEAREALSIQRFDLVLLGSGQPVASCARFVEKLRSLETGQGFDSRASVFAYGPPLGGADFLDGFLPPEFDPEALADAVSRSQAAGQGTAGQLQPDPGAFSAFEPDQFREQCANEPSLMVEIIDLFSAEQDRELSAMHQALVDNDFDRLSRLAHTIKGSLGALHAPLCRQRAQLLEVAAKQRNDRLCAGVLQALEHDLAELNSLLATFRQACLCR